MATITGLTAARMQVIIDTTIQSGYIDAFGHLILVSYDATETDAGYVLSSVPDASETVKGIVELATTTEATTGTDTVRAVTPAGLAAGLATVTIPDASTTVKGKVELATTTEATTGTDSVRAVTPDGLKAAIDALKQIIWPVGSYYTSDLVSTNPNTLLGFGTWSAVQGQFLIGADGTYGAGTTGGEATHTLTSGEIPGHTHTGPSHTHTGPSHTHNVGWDLDGGSGSSRYTVHNTGSSGAGGQAATSAGGTGATGSGGTGATGSTGGGGAHNNIPPYRAVYIWRRTA